MVKINNANLEKALGNQKQPEQPQMSREMEIGHHQGALSTLINERNELIKIIQNVEAVMQAHIKRLEELGIKVQTQNPEKKK